MKALEISTRPFPRLGLVIFASAVFFQCESAPETHDAALAKYPVEPPVYNEIIRESRERPDLLDQNSPEGLLVVQITTNPAVGSNNVYTEAQIFTPDSKRFVFIRQGNLWLCDLEDDFSLRQITDENGAMAPSVSPDGKWMYYFVNNTSTFGGALYLKRVSLENFTRQTLLKQEGPIPGTKYRPNGPFTLSSISSDSKRLCIAAFLGDGKTVNAPFGLLVFDLENSSVKLVFKDQGFHNAHPQYCRSTDPLLSHDIMLQNNHGDSLLVTGRCVRSVSGREGDLHVIRDDGTNWRDIPVGRDSVQFIQGHEQWLGRSGAVLSAMRIRAGERAGERPIFLAWPIPTDEKTSHLGVNIPGGKYVEITRNIIDSDIWHFSSDLTGMYLVSDTYRIDKETGKPLVRLVLGTLSDGDNPELKVEHLLNTGSSGRNPAHPHPFFSPDNRMIFFNSDVDRIVQVFMVTGYKFPEI
ncbi:MAG TPA: hypothetical protein VM123_13665 [archaeon]|nr:hypothetical protein [archaeon]